MLTKTPLLSALACEPSDQVPVWLMRQAGRYLPEYRQLRAKAGSFLTMCKTPDLACEVTMQPIERFGLDAAIIFSDILVIPDALGRGLLFTDGEGPSLTRPVRSESDLAELGKLDPDDLSYQSEAVALCRSELPADIPLIGFAGGPFTLACYMVDGSGGEFLECRRMVHSRFDLLENLLSVIVDAITVCLLGQARAGADVLMVFDSWAGLVPRHLTQQVLIDPLARIVSSLRKEGCDRPVIAFLRGASDVALQAAETGVDALGVDWQSDFGAVSDLVGKKVALQGNLDPAVLLGDSATVEREALRVLRSHRHDAGHIFNLGHGINKTTPIENVEVLVRTVKEYRRESR